MSSVTGVELGPDYCVLLRGRRSGSAIEVTAIRIFDHLEWSTELAVQAGQLRDARRELSLPRRDATPEEVLLRLRQLSSGFETRVDLGITYQFGSRFARIVNPRFGQE